MNEATKISRIKSEKIITEISFLNMKNFNENKKGEMTYDEYLDNYLSKYKYLLPVINEKIEFNEIQSSELTLEIQNLINKKNDLNIELEAIENELHEYGNIYIPSDIQESEKSLEEIVNDIMEHDILKSTAIGTKVSELKGEDLEDAQITLKGECGQYLIKLAVTKCLLEKLKIKYTKDQYLQHEDRIMDLTDNYKTNNYNNKGLSNPNIIRLPVQPDQTSSIKIQVFNGKKIYFFNLSDDAKQVFKVKDLTNKCCEYWGIPQESYKTFYLTHKMLVFNKDELLYNIYISVFEGICDMMLHLHNAEYITKVSLENEIKLNNNNDENDSDDQNNNNNNQGKKNYNLLYLETEDEFDFLKKPKLSPSNKKARQPTIPSSTENDLLNDNEDNNDLNRNSILNSDYDSEFSLYVDEIIIQEKAVEFALGNDELAARLKQEEERISKEFDKDLERKRQQEKEDGLEEDDEERAERNKIEYYKKEEEIERGLESYKFRYYSSLRKYSEIIVTQHELFLLRLRTLLGLIIYIAFIYSLLSDSTLQSADNSFIMDISEIMHKRIFKSEYYQNFMTSQIESSGEFSPNFLIESKRDFNMFFRFVLNNIISKNYEDSKISSFDAVDRYGYNLVNTVKFTTKYAQITLRPDDALDKKLFSGLYPIIDEISNVNEITSNFDLKISELLSENIIDETYVKKIFPTLEARGNGNSERSIEYTYEDTDHNFSERVLRSYNNNGYEFYLSFNNFDAYKYDYFSGQIIRYMVSKPNFKYLKMSLSFYNPRLNSMINLNLVIEVLSIGFIASSFNFNVINIPNDSNIFYEVFTFINLYAVYFILNYLMRVFFCIYAEKRLKNDKTLINRKILIYDLVCILVYLIYLTLENIVSVNYNQNINSYRSNLDFSKTRELTYKDWKFVDLDKIISSIHTVNAIKSFLFFILIMRILLLLRVSLRLSFYYKVFFKILRESAGMAIMFLLILLGFSILISLFVGQKFYAMTSIFNTLYIAFKFITYFGESDYFYYSSNIEKFIFIFIVFLIGTAIFPISKSVFKFVYYEEFKNYKRYKSQITFKSNGDFIDFLESFLYGNIYYLISNYLELRRVKNNINKIIDRKFDIDKFNLKNGPSIISMRHERRDVHFIYEPKKSNLVN